MENNNESHIFVTPHLASPSPLEKQQHFAPLLPELGNFTEMMEGGGNSSVETQLSEYCDLFSQ